MQCGVQGGAEQSSNSPARCCRCTAVNVVRDKGMGLPSGAHPSRGAAAKLCHTNSQMALGLLHSVLDPTLGAVAPPSCPPPLSLGQNRHISLLCGGSPKTRGFAARLLVPELFLQSIEMRSR